LLQLPLQLQALVHILLFIGDEAIVPAQIHPLDFIAQFLQSLRYLAALPFLGYADGGNT